MTVPQYPTRWGVPWLGEWVWTRRIGRNQYTMEGVALRFLVCARDDRGLRSVWPAVMQGCGVGAFLGLGNGFKYSRAKLCQQQ